MGSVWLRIIVISDCPPGREPSTLYNGLCVTPGFDCEGDYIEGTCCKYGKKKSMKKEKLFLFVFLYIPVTLTSMYSYCSYFMKFCASFFLRLYCDWLSVIVHPLHLVIQQRYKRWQVYHIQTVSNACISHVRTNKDVWFQQFLDAIQEWQTHGNVGTYI